MQTTNLHIITCEKHHIPTDRTANNISGIVINMASLDTAVADKQARVREVAAFCTLWTADNTSAADSSDVHLHHNSSELCITTSISPC